MSPTALDRMTDDFPHGTIEGERAGCVGSDCIATPLTCAEIGGNYRRDFRFQRLYKSGLRGQELLEAYNPIAAVDSARPATPKRQPVTERPLPVGRKVTIAEPTPAPEPEADETAAHARSAEVLGPNFKEAPAPERDRRLIAAVDAGLKWTQIAQAIGSTPQAVSMMHKAAVRRANRFPVSGPADAQTAASDQVERPSAAEPTGQPVEATTPDRDAGIRRIESETAPVSAATAADRFGAPPVVIEDIAGPQIAQMWVVLDREKQIVLATTDPRKATAALAETWAAQLGIEA